MMKKTVEVRNAAPRKCYLPKKIAEPARRTTRDPSPIDVLLTFEGRMGKVGDCGARKKAMDKLPTGC